MNYQQPDWDAINLEKRKQIAWNSAINNATQLYASGVIQDIPDFHDKIREYYDLILNMPLEGSKMPVDESFLLEMCERLYEGKTFTAEEYERLTETGKKVVNVIKKSMKTTERWKDKANGNAPKKRTTVLSPEELEVFKEEHKEVSEDYNSQINE